MSIYSEIRPEVAQVGGLVPGNSKIDPELYVKYDVKRGPAGLKRQRRPHGPDHDLGDHLLETVDGQNASPCEGELYYRGYSVEELVRRQPQRDNFGFERTAYLLLFGDLPTPEDLKGLLPAALLLPDPAHQLCPGHHHEGPQL